MTSANVYNQQRGHAKLHTSRPAIWQHAGAIT